MIIIIHLSLNPIKDTEHLKEFDIVKNEHLDFIEQDEISNVNTSDEKKCSNVPLAIKQRQRIRWIK